MRDSVMDKECNDFSDFKENDINILQIINEEDLTCFTFEGLKRRLKIHPETLSRILYRLADQDILKKGNNGYTLTSNAKKLLKSNSFDSTNHSLRLLQTFIPLEVSIKKVISDLKGKWFGVLRWLGYSIANEGVTLKWITEDGGTIISAIFSQGKLYIDAKMVSENDINSALNASHQLMAHITKSISRSEHN
jgi:DNA-binding Lrp family transcriptional regulator